MPEPQIRPADVLAFGSEAQLVRNITPKAATHASELRDLRQQGTSGREAMRQNIAQAEHAAYSPQSAEGLKARFGGGAGNLDAQGQAVLNPNATAEQRTIFNEAVAAIDRSSRVLTYLQLMTEQNPQASFQYINQANRPGLQGINSFAVLRTGALNTIANDPSFRRQFPELYAQGISDSQRREYIEATLTSDPLFRAKMGERMAQVYTNALQLPEIAADQPIQQARQQEGEQQTAYDQQADNFVQFLTNRGINQLTIPEVAGGAPRVINVDRASIQQLLQASPNADSARNSILQGIMNCDAQTLIDVQDLEITIPAQLATVQERMIDLHARVVGNRNVNAAQLRQNLQNIPGGPVLLQQEAQLEQRQQNLQNALTLGGNLAQADQIFRNTVVPLPSQGVSQQNTQGEFGTLLSQAKGAQTTLDRTRQRLAGLQAVRTPERATQEAQRMLAERKLLGQTDTIIGEAVADVYEKRYDEMLPLEQKKQEESAKKTEEQKGARTGRLQRQIQQEEKNRWIEIDPTTGKTIHFDNIAEDMDLLIYQGENGLKRIFLRNMFGPNATFTVSRVDARGNKTNRQVNWQAFNFVTDELKPDDKTVFDGAYEAESANYRKKMMTDYFLARSVNEGRVGRLFGHYKFDGSPSSLHFKDYEWEALNKNFGADIDATIKSSKEAQAAIQKLKDKGINMEQHGRLKWLLYILIVLGVIGLVGGGAMALHG